MGWPCSRSAHRHQHHRNRCVLADTLKRYLLITRRRIPLDSKEDYRALWHAVRAAATAGGARAWIFRAARTDDRFTEFVEWQSHANDSIIERAEVAAAIDALNAAFPFEESDTWQEARI